MTPVALIHAGFAELLILLFLGIAALGVLAAVVVVAVLAVSARRRHRDLEARLKTLEEKVDRANKPGP